MTIENEIAGCDAIIEGLAEELRRCPATRRGYQDAADLRGSIALWRDQKARLIAQHTALTE